MSTAINKKVKMSFKSFTAQVFIVVVLLAILSAEISKSKGSIEAYPYIR